MDKLLTIIVPVYNAERFLDKCIKSIIEAANQDCEIILVDDGSEDLSGKICDEYAKQDERIKVFHQKNMGVISARKTGVLNASGKFITFVDSDDWVSVDMYGEMLLKAKENDADVVICDMIHETKTGPFLMKNYIKPGLYEKERLNNEFYGFMVFNFDECFPGVNPSLCNKLIKKELLDKVIFNVDDSIVYGEDALCVYPVMLDARKIYVMAEGGFYHYRQNSYSVTNVYDKKLLAKSIRLFEELERLFKERRFDYKDQLTGYIARHSIECIRFELLFGKENTLKERIKVVDEYIKNDKVFYSFPGVFGKIKDRKTKLKMYFVIKRRFFLLYLMFYVKLQILNRKGKKYEN